MKKYLLAAVAFVAAIGPAGSSAFAGEPLVTRAWQRSEPALGQMLRRSDRATDIDEFARKMQVLVAKSWRISNRIWPDTNMADRYLILVAGDQAREISLAGVVPVPRSSVETAPPHTFPGPGAYRFIWWKEGRQATVIDLDQTLPWTQPVDALPPRPEVEEVHRFAVHETFHLIQFAEQRWNVPRPEVFVPEYPLSDNASLYRAMLYHTLRTAAADPGRRDERLAEAAYWNTAFTAEFPKAAAASKFGDLAEGAAQHFETQMLAATLIDHPEDDAARRAKASELTHALTPGMLRFYFINSFGHTYLVGQVAGGVLDRGDSPWRTDAVAGRSPVASLLDNVTPPVSPPSPDTAIVRDNTVSVAQRNVVLGVQLEPAIQGFLDPGHVLLLLPPWWEMRVDPSKEKEIEEAMAQTVPYATGLYASGRLPHELYSSWVGAYLLGNGNFVIKNLAALKGSIDSREYMIVPLDPSAPGFQLSDGRLDLTMSAMYGSLPVEKLVDGNGRILLRAIDNR
ncbi:MAG: hypothetical protein JWQ61_3584 [Collimonas fungivorans]|uniref:hypothetical protein n=1 Tax=Collimonas fungivorans TaxID=158899 RepID=UPI0026EBEB5A|nr:hypothetical protein [Collimonas fungivorans]MDB5768770.1 hypothetical protein [Collimonas fungivorans]